MDTATLVSFPTEVRQAGWKLLHALDAEQVDCSGLFWTEFESDDWRFFVVSARIGTDGPRRYWQDVLRAMERLTEDERDLLFDVGVVTVNPNEMAVREVRRHYGTVEKEESQAGRRLSLGPGEAFVYRMR